MSSDSKPTRRHVLRGIAATTLIGAAAPAAEARRYVPRRLARRFVFRLSTRKRSSCRACKNHHKYVIATGRGLLDAHRAHPGCNCPIKRQVVSARDFRRWFPDGEGVIDLRWMGVS